MYREEAMLHDMLGDLARGKPVKKSIKAKVIASAIRKAGRPSVTKTLKQVALKKIAVKRANQLKKYKAMPKAKRAAVFAKTKPKVKRQIQATVLRRATARRKALSTSLIKAPNKKIAVAKVQRMAQKVLKTKIRPAQAAKMMEKPGLIAKIAKRAKVPIAPEVEAQVQAPVYQAPLPDLDQVPEDMAPEELAPEEETIPSEETEPEEGEEEEEGEFTPEEEAAAEDTAEAQIDQAQSPESDADASEEGEEDEEEEEEGMSSLYDFDDEGYGFGDLGAKKKKGKTPKPALKKKPTKLKKRKPTIHPLPIQREILPKPLADSGSSNMWLWAIAGVGILYIATASRPKGSRR